MFVVLVVAKMAVLTASVYDCNNKKSLLSLHVFLVHGALIAVQPAGSHATPQAPNLVYLASPGWEYTNVQLLM